MRTLQVHHAAYARAASWGGEGQPPSLHRPGAGTGFATSFGVSRMATCYTAQATAPQKDKAGEKKGNLRKK